MPRPDLVQRYGLVISGDLVELAVDQLQLLHSNLPFFFPGSDRAQLSTQTRRVISGGRPSSDLLPLTLYFPG